MRRAPLFTSLLSLGVLCVLCTHASAEEPCKSGLDVGQRPGPYSALISTGPQRGQSYCYVCETGDRPAVVIFVRSLSEPLGKLVGRLDQAVRDHKKDELRAWVTFLSDNQLALDPQVVRWAEKYAVSSMPLGVFEDRDGPPSYRLGRDADVTVVVFVKRRVVADFAFRAGELNDEQAGRVLKALPKILAGK